MFCMNCLLFNVNKFTGFRGAALKGENVGVKLHFVLNLKCPLG